MKVLIGIVVFIIIEIGFVMFMYEPGTRKKEVDGQILQNRWFERSVGNVA